MSTLLHIDSSIHLEDSVSRALTARAAGVWRETHPGGQVIYRDLGSDPVPHFDTRSGLARMVPGEAHTREQADSMALSLELIEEIKSADTIILGLPVYNFGAPSSVKAWVDHLIAPGHSVDPETNEGFFGDKDFLVLESRGGGYGEGTPREGWDHAEQWLPHGVYMLGLEPRFITAELTLANSVPAMETLKPLAAESLAAAERAIDAQWKAPVAA